MLSNSVFCNTLTETHSVAVLLVVIMESRVARIFFLVLCPQQHFHLRNPDVKYFVVTLYNVYEGRAT